MGREVNMSSAGIVSSGGIYAPLRQLVTDSESEEDCRNRGLRISGSDTCNNLDINSGLTMKNNNYSVSELEDTQAHTLDTSLDNVSFLHSDASTRMTLPRKLAFLTSIFVCVFTVVAFLWFVPCSDSGCSAAEWRDRTTSWELPYDEIELSGAVQVVDAAQPDAKNLIFIYRGNHVRKLTSTADSIDNGVLLIVGSSGKIGWYTREFRIPTQIDCHLLDVNADGRKDCVVVGTEGLLAAIDPLSGTYFWYLQRAGGKGGVMSLDFPVVVKDADGDKIDDLLTSARIAPNADHNSLLLVSGASGHMVGEPITVEGCRAIHSIVVNAGNVTYSCRSNASESLRVITYDALQRYILSAKTPPVRLAPAAKENRDLSLKKTVEKSINYFKNGAGKLMIENTGHCPDNCRVSIRLTLEKNGTVWRYAADHVHGARAVPFSFAGAVHGFVLKL